MRDYLIRRLILIIPTFFLITVISFSLIHLAPGDPLTIMQRRSKLTPEMRELITRDLGLDQPLHTQYVKWLDGLFHGNLGYSYLEKRPVIDIISVRVPLTVELMLAAEITSVLLAVVLGVIAAVKHYSVYDALSSLTALVGYSIPDFWLGLMLMLVFAVQLKWLPIGGVGTVGIDFPTPFHALLDHIAHLLLPALTLVAVWTAYLFRMVRSAMLEVLTQDYITTARSKGLKETVVIYKHALRNALLPIVTYVGYSIGFLLSGAAIIETIFAWPGLGQLMVDRAAVRDFPTLMGLSIVIALMVLIANLASDIAYAAVDPRIRYD
jgi:peptide/nickel transport system permease protein